jgi:acetyl-CoA acetyltransferase family protein
MSAAIRNRSCEANLVLTRQKTRTELRAANGEPSLFIGEQQPRIRPNHALADHLRHDEFDECTDSTRQLSTAEIDQIDIDTLEAMTRKDRHQISRAHTGQCHDFRQQGNAQARQRCLEKRLRRIGAEALSSQLKAVAAQRNGFFDAEITPVTIAQRKGDPIVVSKDEHPRETSLEALARLQGVVRPDGTVTAGNASGVNDGAAALLLASEAVAVRHGLTPRAHVVGLATAGVEPRIMGIGPTPATQKVLDLSGLTLEQMDVIELNEAFAAQGLAVLRQLGLADDDPRVNPNGGAIALGHPLGASGARLAATAVNQLHRVRGRYALCTMCIGVGQGIAVILERV